MNKSKIKRPILWKLVLIIGIPLIIAYSAVLVINYNLSKDAALKQMQNYLIELTGRNAVRLDGQFSLIADLPRSISNILQSLEEIKEEEIYSLLEGNILNNPFTFGELTMDKCLNSSKKMDWGTPQFLYDQLDAEFGFNVDVCAHELNHKCYNYFTSYTI